MLNKVGYASFVGTFVAATGAAPKANCRRFNVRHGFDHNANTIRKDKFVNIAHKEILMESMPSRSTAN